MRKLALLLGSLLVVASASAKEVVPAPVVVEEAPVQVIEKEVIVYRDKEVGFRPNGYVSLKYKYYGDIEEQDFRHDGMKSNYGRTEIMGYINMTEKQSLEYRTRTYNDWNHKSTSGDPKTVGKEDTQVRLRYYYNHGLLGDSKVDFTSHVEYIHDYDDVQKSHYEARFNFADYMFNNDYVKTTDFTLAPRYGYDWDSNDSNYANRLGLALYTNTKLPLGFNLELNFYAQEFFYGNDKEWGLDKKKDDKNFQIDMELYLTNNVNLYTNGKHAIDFTVDMGYDPYTWSENDKVYGGKIDRVKSEDDVEYKLYARPGVKYTYSVTPTMNAFVDLEAEYANFKYSNENSSRDFRWQPLATVGMKTTF